MSGSSCKGSVTITSRGRILKVSDKEIKLATRAFFAPSLDTFFSPARLLTGQEYPLHTARPMISEEMDGAQNERPLFIFKTGLDYKKRSFEA